MPGMFDDLIPAEPSTQGGAGMFEDLIPRKDVSVGKDVAKQIGTGLVVGTEAIPAAPAVAAGWLGGLAQKVLPESWQNAPLARAIGLDTSGPSAAEQQAQMRELTSRQQGGGIAQYLPKPETTYGEYARSGAQMIPSMVGATKISPVRAAAAGATAGLTSEAAGQATAGTPLEPYARIGGAVVGGGAALRRLSPTGIPPLETPQVKTAATTAYDALRDETRAIPLAAPDSRMIADRIRAHVNQIGPRAKRAQAAHKEIDDLTNARDVGDLIESRQALAELTRGSGPDIAGARIAINVLDPLLDHLAPGTAGRLQAADKNYAIAMRTAEVEQKIKDAIERERSRTLTGDALRNAIEPMLERGRAERMSPAVQAAIQRTARPGVGVRALRGLSEFDPVTRRLLPTMLGLGAVAHNPLLAAPMVAGGIARPWYDAILKSRAAQIPQAMRAEAPASLAQPGFVPSTAARPSPAIPSLLGLMPEWQRQRQQY